MAAFPVDVAGRMGRLPAWRESFACIIQMQKRKNWRQKEAGPDGRAMPFGAVCALVIGFYGWSANSGVLELMGSGAHDSYYNLLVQGFRDGHLSVKREAPPDIWPSLSTMRVGWTIMDCMT